jgi:hypothetical protein
MEAHLSTTTPNFYSFPFAFFIACTCIHLMSVSEHLSQFGLAVSATIRVPLNLVSPLVLGAVYTCPNLRTNCRTIPCTICMRTKYGSNYFSLISLFIIDITSHVYDDANPILYLTLITMVCLHISRKINKKNHLLDPFSRKSYTESYADLYAKSHV